MSKIYIPWEEAEANAPIHSMENLPIMHRQWAFRDFEGKLLTLIESMGLPEKQENAVKSYVRRELWDFVRTGIIIPDEIDNTLSSGHLVPGGIIAGKKIKKSKS